MKVVLQGERHECGIACIAMLIEHNGGRSNLPALRHRHQLNVRGTTAQALIEIAQSEGLTLEGYELEDGDFTKIPVGSILHYHRGHYVVLESIRNSIYTVIDPEKGRQALDGRQLKNLISGVVLVQEGCSLANLPSDRRMGMLSLVAKLGLPMAPYAPSLTKIMLLSLAIQGMLLTAPLYLQTMIDTALPSRDYAVVLKTAIIFSALAIAASWASILRGRTVISVGLNIARRASEALLEKLGRASLSWHERQNSSAIYTRFHSINPLQQLGTQGAIDGVIDGVLLLAMLAMMATYGLMITAITIATTTTVLVIRLLAYPNIRALQEAQYEYEAKEQALGLENLQGIRSLHIYNGVALRHRAQLNVMTARFNAALQQQRIQQVLRHAAVALYTLDTIVIVALSMRAIMTGNMTIGGLVAFMMYKAIFGQKSEVMIERVIDMRLAQLHVDRLADIAMADEMPTAPVPPVSKGAVELRDVSFSYYGEESVINGQSLSIEPGAHIAITGHTGQGKTTIAKLLAGVLAPTAGEILIDNAPAALHRAGLVFMMQDDLLYSGTIMDNVDVANTGTAITVRKALKQACVWDEVHAMPMGLHTVVGREGVEISGGQKQRILLARALHAAPALLIMDEATSHLDDETEAAVNRHLAKIGATRIVIAHRQQTIASAEQVYDLAGGKFLRKR